MKILISALLLLFNAQDGELDELTRLWGKSSLRFMRQLKLDKSRGP
jgi:hypothetical protein